MRSCHWLLHIENDVGRLVNEQAQWMTENISTSPTIDSHVLAMNLTPAVFVHTFPTGRSHGVAPHKERSKSMSGWHWTRSTCLTTSWPRGERYLPATPCLLQWAMRPGHRRKRDMGNVLTLQQWWHSGDIPGSGARLEAASTLTLQ
jgi:hypothetical protein